MFTDHAFLEILIFPELQRYVLSVQLYDFSLHYKRGEKNTLADFGSRIPNGKEAITEVSEELEVNTLDSGSEMRLNLKLIAIEIVKDPD